MRMILTNWNWARVIRLLIGLAALGQGIYSKENTMLMAGGLIVLFAFLNYGCGGRNGCAVPIKKDQEKNLMQHEELDPK